jgi:hypothetical protein
VGGSSWDPSVTKIANACAEQEAGACRNLRTGVRYRGETSACEDLTPPPDEEEYLRRYPKGRGRGREGGGPEGAVMG